MKIFIAVENNMGLDSHIDKRFGRAEYFMVYDMDEDKIESIKENNFKDISHGVGIKVSAMVVDLGCKAVIGAQPGPKAAEVLKKAKIRVMIIDQGNVWEAIERFKSEYLN